MGEGEETIVQAEPLGTPSAPLSLHCEEDAHGINLTWLPPEETGGRDILGYHIYRDGAYYATVPGTQTWFYDDDADEPRLYGYQVMGYSEVGEGDLTEWEGCRVTGGVLDGGQVFPVGTYLLLALVACSVALGIRAFAARGRSKDGPEGEESGKDTNK